MAKHNKDELVALLTAIADEHDACGRCDTADGIRALLNEVDSGKRDCAEVSIQGRLKVAKFNGRRTDKCRPVETQEFITEI